MLKIEWNEEIMSVGIETIDTQHKNMIELINNIMISIKNSTQSKHIEAIIKEAIDYTHYHFYTEEELLKKQNLEKEQIDKHIKEHESFKNKIDYFYEKITNNNIPKTHHSIELMTELYLFLSDWLTHHIVIEDKKLLCKLI